MRVSYAVGGILLAGVLILISWQFWPATNPQVLPATTPSSMPSTDIPSTPADVGKPQRGPDDASIEINTPATIAENPVSETNAVVAAEPIELPPLAASDAWVRESVMTWSLPTVWLEQEGLIQRGASLLVNVAQGTLPRRQLRFLQPATAFKVQRRGQYFFAEASNSTRFDGYVTTLRRVPVDSAANLVHQLAPLFEQALGQLGERRSLDELLHEAVRRVQDVPVLTESPALKRPQVLYLFVDPELEALSGLQKQLLRLGPENLAALQQFASQFERAYTRVQR